VIDYGRLAGLPLEEPFPGIRRRAFSSASATVTEYVLEPGASFPQHHHPQEQLTLLQSGDVELTAEDRLVELSAGDWFVVAGGVEHGLRAGADGARFLAVLVPRRDPSDPYTLTPEGAPRR
jgi:quercetin dioxygenase-like cupin family protein